MATIPEYFSRENTINPSATGASAWEQAGRRIGPLYNEAASFRERQGRLAASAERQKLWPFDILRLYQIQATAAAQRAAAADRSGFRVQSGRGATGNASDFGPQATGEVLGRFDDLGQVARGAAALASAVSDGGYGVAGSSRGGGGGRGAGAAPSDGTGGEYTLYQGQFVSSEYGRRIDAESRAKADERMNNYGRDLSDYYQEYYGYRPVPAGNQDPSQGTPGNPVSNMSPPYDPYSQQQPASIYPPPADTGWFSGLSQSNNSITAEQQGEF